MITVVGEALMDLVRPLGSSATASEHPGGSPANVALGLSRLGIAATLQTQLGDDARGKVVRDHLAASGVTVRVLGGATTSTATAIIDEGGGARYEFDIDWAPEAPLRAEPGSTCVHTGSLATALEPGAATVEALIERERAATISFDPNVRPSLMGSPDTVRDRIERLAAKSDVVKVSDEDLGWLYPGREPLAVAREWRDRGPAVVVVTLGGDGGLAVTAAGEVRRPGLPVAVADTVGAGDAFTAGMLHWLDTAGLLGAARHDDLHRIDPDQVRGMLDAAIATSAITCSRRGAEPPTLAELAAFTRRSRQGRA